MQNWGLIKYKAHHILFWLLIAGLWYALRYQDYATTGIAWQITFIKTVALAAAVYITNLLLIPQLLYKQRYFFAVLAFLLLITMGSIIKVFLMAQVLHQPDLFGISGNLKTKLYENLISDFFLVLTFASFKLILDFIKMQQRLAEIAKEKAETELNFLKSQINPHFLFNSLNSVYFLINKDNPQAREALHKFSDMLRYQLYEVKDNRIPIEKELDYLKDYVDLQKLRKDGNYFVEFNCTDNVKGFQIEPLLLIPFVENAFKHISHHTDGLNTIKVNISYSDDEFNFTVKNSKELNHRSIEQSGGIGLNNVKRRLELLYPGKHELQINESMDKYSVILKLKIEN